MISGGLNYETEAADSEFSLSPFEADTIGEIMNISMGSAATAISSLLDRKVVITTPTVSTAIVSSIKYTEFEPAMCVEITYVKGISGSNVMVFRQSDIAMILDILMGRETTPIENFEFDEIAVSAACEVMNQMMGASATALSNFLGVTIDISTPNAILQEKVDIVQHLNIDPNDRVTVIKFDLQIDGVTTTEFASILSMSLTREIIGRMTGEYEENDPPVDAPAAIPEPAAPAPSAMPQMPQMTAIPEPITPSVSMPSAMEQSMQQQTQQTPPMMDQQMMQQAMSQMPQMMQQPMVQQPMMQPQMMMPQPNYYGNMAPPMPVNAKNIILEQLSSSPMLQGDGLSNLEMIMSVPMQVTVEIGRTHKKIKEILDFTQGTIVELDKQAGSPVDIIVNGQPVARGDVVVIDDNFAIRITEILKTKDLLENL